MKKLGRKPLPGADDKTIKSFSCPNPLIAKAEKVGKGNFSAGVIIMMRKYRGNI